MNTPDHSQADVHLVVLTGMSGGGKTITLRAMEDLNFYCVDNLPAPLLTHLVKVLHQEQGSNPRIAVGIDVRSEDLSSMPGMLSELAAEGVHVHLVFVDSCDEVLLKRYAETRRKHPLSASGLSLASAIARERKLLNPLMSIAENIIDTSELNVHQLRRLIATRYAVATKGMTLLFESFAYKKGLPLDTDFVFDARCLPNPHWDRTLRPLSGKDEPVRKFFQSQPMADAFFNDVTQFLDTWLPRFEHADRHYVTISIGCTGGRHRSVYLTERLSRHFRENNDNVLTFHRELD